MQDCMAGYPELYPGKEDEEEGKEFSNIGSAEVDEVQTDSTNAEDDESHKIKDVSSASWQTDVLGIVLLAVCCLSKSLCML